MIYERNYITDWKELIKEGNIIKIRQWGDMEEEYGYSSLENAIMCEHLFTDFMEELCGKEFKITKDIEEDFKEYGYFYTDDLNRWDIELSVIITTDMIESVKTTDGIVIKDKVTFISDDKKGEIIKRLEKSLNYDRELYDKMKIIPLPYFTKTVQDELQEDFITYMLIETVKNL